MRAAVLTVAQDSPMAGAFGNRIVSTDPGGAATRTWVDADVRYLPATAGAVSSGSWAVQHGMIYHSQTVPVSAPPLCTIGPRKKVRSKG